MTCMGCGGFQRRVIMGNEEWREFRTRRKRGRKSRNRRGSYQPHPLSSLTPCSEMVLQRRRTLNREPRESIIHPKRAGLGGPTWSLLRAQNAPIEPRIKE